MEQEYRHAIALMRYSAIAPLIPGLPEGYRNLADYLEKTSQKGLLHPDGEVRNYAPKTLYKWYFSYQKGGFDALLPAGRNDCGRSRKLDDDLKEKISYLKGRYPRMGAAAIFRQLKEDGSIRLRCSPGMDEVYVAEADGTLLPVRLLNKQENASVKREKLLLSEGGEG